MTNSIFYKLGSPYHELYIWDYPKASLYDSNTMILKTAAAQGNVFLKNYKLYETQWGDRQFWASKAENAGYGIYRPTFALSIDPEEHDGKTYFATSSHMMTIDAAETFANRFGGHVVTISDAEENQYLTSYWRNRIFGGDWSTFGQRHPGLNCGYRICLELFGSPPWIGLTDREQEGTFIWISGEPVVYTNWSSGQPDNRNCSQDYVYIEPWSGQWDDHWSDNFYEPANGFGAWFMEVPGTWTQAQLDAERNTFITGGYFNEFKNNAILNVWWDPNISRWMRFYVQQQQSYDSRNWFYYLTDNFWGTNSATLIDAALQDFNDDFNLPHVVYQPILTAPVTTTYPFVVDVLLSTASQSGMSALHGPTPIVGAETVTFIVTFNRDMDTSVQPSVSFGPDVPETDYTIHPIEGGWADPRTWVGTFNITPITGDGYQLMRIAGARAADDPWLVTGDDSERFRFEIITSGTEAMNLQATGGEGYVDLQWTQNDFDLLAGYNLYRATSPSGPFNRLNPSLIPAQQRSWRDTNVIPGQPYYYRFTVVKTDMTESAPSNIATATPIDTIPPVISHTPVTEAPPGLPLTIFADVTDNVGVQAVSLHYRAIGATQYISRAMTRTTGNRYSATIEGSQVTSPGVEYYIEASDGISTVRFGRPEYPYQVAVVDRPVVTAVSPNRGPASGGTAVTIAGSNFKPGATVTFGSAAADNVTVLSGSQITCITPPHFPATVDVTVRNPNGQSGTLLRGFTYESDVASVSLPNTGGGQHDIVQVPVNAASVNGLAAADLTVTFNSSVLSARGARTGSLTPGWSVVVNTGTPGQIRLSMASPGGTVSGSGTLAILEFEVVGSPGTTTTLHISNISLNDGAIPVQAADGSFAVSLVYRVSGAVRFWNGSAGVPGVLLSLEGDRVYTGLSDATGTYTVTGAPAGSYTLTPSKSDGVNGISAYDASLVLQHAAGLITLSGHQATAGDVDKSSTITAMDAFYILQKAVELITLPFPGAGVVWDFDPRTRSYPNLSSNQTGQDFTAILLGDVSGNWSASGSQAASLQTAAPVTITVRGGPADVSGRATATLWLDASGVEVYSLDLALSYDPAMASAVDVRPGSLASSLMSSANLGRPGQVLLALAGAAPISGSGELARVTFQMASLSAGSTALMLSRGEVNEGQAPAHLVSGRLGGSQLYLPLVAKQ